MQRRGACHAAEATCGCCMLLRMLALFIILTLLRWARLSSLVQDAGRRGSRGGGPPLKQSAPDLDAVARAAALQQRVDEQDIELAALKVLCLFWQPLPASCHAGSALLYASIASKAAHMPYLWLLRS